MSGHRGLRWDPETKTARLEVSIPGTAGKSRRRETVFAATEDDAHAELVAFRSFVECEDRQEDLDDASPLEQKKPFDFRKRAEQHCVYVIGYEGDPAVKLGLAVDMDRRLVNYRTHYWKEPTVIALCYVSTWNAARDLEGALLRRLKKHVIRGEWLHRTPEVLDVAGTSSALCAFAVTRGIRAISPEQESADNLTAIAAALSWSLRA